METEETLSPKSAASAMIDKEELKSFYTSGLPEMLKALLFEPINGTYSFFSKRSDKTYLHSLFLMATTVILYIIVSYALMGELRTVLGFSAAFKTGIGVLIFMLCVSAIAFGIKAISGKPNFKNELLTGGLCAIPLIIILVLAIVAKMFAGDASSSVAAMTNPADALGKAGFLLLLMFYAFLMLINILQQSLRAAGAKDAFSWYLSPAGIFLAGYITFKITAGMF